MNILDDICRYVNDYSKISIFFAIFIIYLPTTNIYNSHSSFVYWKAKMGKRGAPSPQPGAHGIKRSMPCSPRAAGWARRKW